MSVAARVAGLLSRAVHDATPLEEARTSAILLAKLIAKHGLIVHEPNGCPEAPPLPVVEPGVPISSGRWLICKWKSHCFFCGEAVEIGERVWWVKTRGVMCHPCWLEELEEVK